MKIPLKGQKCKATGSIIPRYRIIKATGKKNKHGAFRKPGDQQNLDMENYKVASYRENEPHTCPPHTVAEKRKINAYAKCCARDNKSISLGLEKR